MTELDDALRQSFARIAEPGDPAGVVDAMRARMAAGDTGTPAATSGFTAGAGWVIPWIFGGALLAIGGVVLGASGLLGTPFAPEQSSSTAVLQVSAQLLDCPGGAPVGTLVAGNRVLAVARSDDGAYIGVRNPYDTGMTVWLSRDVVSTDDGATVDSLPIEECPLVVTTEITPTPVETLEPEPTAPPTSAPQPPADATAPTLANASVAPSTFYNDEAALVQVSAADNVGVTAVTVQISGAYTGTATMTKVGAVWQLSFAIPDDNYYGSITFTMRAVDAAGNVSAPLSASAYHQFFG